MYRSVVTGSNNTGVRTTERQGRDDRSHLTLVQLPQEVAGSTSWSVVGVLGASPITHSAGLAAVDAPEFLVRGLPPEIGAGVVRYFAEQALAGTRFRHGQVVLGHQLHELPLTLIRVTDLADLVTIRRASPGATVLQVVWPDLNLCFPWQAGYALAPGLQPVHGRVGQVLEEDLAPVVRLGDRMRP